MSITISNDPAGREPIVEGTGATVASVVSSCHDQGVDRALERWPSLTREGLEPVLAYCAEQRCERDAAYCATCRLRTLKEGLDTFDALVERHRLITFRSSPVRLEGNGTLVREEESLDTFADRWRGEEHWFLARRVIRKLRHGPRRARELVAAVENVGATPAVMLLEPQMAANVGMVARAMANFGLDELVVVNPRDGWPSEKARILASGASAIVDGARLAPDLKAGLAPFDWVCATTARQREMVKPVLSPETAAREMRRRLGEGQRCAILFGRERNGLTSDEVADCDAVVMIPVNSSFASLNLAQAALILGYEWLKETGEATLGRVTTYEAALEQGLQVKKGRMANKEEMIGFFEHLEAELDRLGFLSPPDKRPTMVRNVRSMFMRMGATEQEVRTLRGIVAALAKGKGAGRKAP